MDIKTLNELFEAFADSTQTPNEKELDDLYYAIQILNRAEWFVNTQKDCDVLVNAQKILNKVLKKHSKK